MRMTKYVQSSSNSRSASTDQVQLSTSPAIPLTTTAYYCNDPPSINYYNYCNFVKILEMVLLFVVKN
jgi:hypothetical protein